MRQFSPFVLAALAVFSLLELASYLEAQQPKRPAAAPANPQPATRPAPQKSAAVIPAGNKAKEENVEPEIEKLPPELEEILARWEIESAKIKSMHGKQTRHVFNNTFAVEMISKGEFFVETPDKGRIDMIAVTPKEKETGVRKDAKGQLYALEKGPSERLICTGEEILEFNLDDKTYSRNELPVQLRGKNIVHSPLPFLFGMKAEEAKRRFKLTMGKRGKDYVWLQAFPRMNSDRQNYNEARILLDTQRFVPTLVKLFDENGLETHYEFVDVKVNDTGFRAKVTELFKGDPFKPSLRGFTLQIDGGDEPPVNRVLNIDGVRPAGNTNTPTARDLNGAQLNRAQPPRVGGQEPRNSNR